MSGIDRRTLLGAAGAGLVLAGCSSNPKKKHHMDMVGTCALHGQSVTDEGPEVPGNVTAFEPDRICIVYLKFAANLMQVRRTYIGTDGLSPTDPGIQTKILTELKRISAWGTAESNDRDDLDPIRLGGQRLVVLYVNNDKKFIRFAFRRGGTAQQETETYTHTVRFTEFSGDDPINKSRIIRKNHAFFNMKKMLFDIADSKMESDEAFILEFWNTDEYGDRLEVVENQPVTHYTYSMNIKLEMATPVTGGTERWVPVIVDPDTGNMGAEP